MIVRETMNRLPISLGAVLLFIFTHGASAWGQYDQVLSRSQGWQLEPAVSVAFYVEKDASSAKSVGHWRRG